jgi:hypothetical protein
MKIFVKKQKEKSSIVVSENAPIFLRANIVKGEYKSKAYIADKLRGIIEEVGGLHSSWDYYSYLCNDIRVSVSVMHRKCCNTNLIQSLFNSEHKAKCFLVNLFLHRDIRAKMSLLQSIQM